MSSFESRFYWLKLGALLLFCFVGGAWLTYHGIAENGGRITFDGVFPGLSAITAGSLVVSLIYYMRRRSREDTDAPEPSNATSDTRSQAAPEPGRVDASAGGTEVAPAGWLELTPMRRQLLLTGIVFLCVIGGCFLRAKRAVDNSKERPRAARVAADADEPSQPRGSDSGTGNS